MEYLTHRQIAALAPGATHRKDAAKEKLLDTMDFMKSIAPEYWPVFALQGTTHKDSKTTAWEGRHLVVASREDGICLALLNSHCRLLRVHVGMGLWDGEELLLGPTLAVQRWRGVDAQLEQFTNERTVEKIKAWRDGLQVKSMTQENRAAVAQYVARSGYIDGRGRPKASELCGGTQDGSLLTGVFNIVAKARHGNLAPSSGADRRNVKGIRRPDALWHLAKAALAGALKVSGV